MPIAELISAIIFLVIIFAWRFFEYIIKLYRNQNMFKKIGWIAEGENPNIVYDQLDVSLRSNDLISYICDAQNNSTIPQNCRIDFSNEVEKTYVETILNVHKEQTIKKYFIGFLKPSKKLCNLNSLEYYMLSLHGFIEATAEKTNFYFGYDLYNQRKLTDFGKIWNKLDLIVFTFVDKNENIRKILGYKWSGRADILIRRLEGLNDF